MSIKLVIADDHEVVRTGLKTALEAGDIRIVGEAANGQIALKLVRKLRPEIVLLDVRMPDGDGLECLARIKLDFPATHVAMFSASDNPAYIARAVALGASGYLLKSARLEEIRAAVQALAAGETLWSREVLRRVSGALSPQTGGDIDVSLTKREGEVLRHIALGLTNKEIATALSISYETVKEHVQHILQKLGVTDRTQAAVWAVRKNLA